MSVYKEGQLVWAKVEGYSWWPALVVRKHREKNQKTETTVEVNFIGDYTCAVLPEDKIADFQQNFNRFSKVRGKKLQEAIQSAKKIVDDTSRLCENQSRRRKQADVSAINTDEIISEEKTRSRSRKSEGKSSVISRQSSVTSEVCPSRKGTRKIAASKDNVTSQSRNRPKTKSEYTTPKASSTKVEDFEFQRVTRSRAKLSHIELIPESKQSSARKSRKETPAKIIDKNSRPRSLDKSQKIPTKMSEDKSALSSRRPSRSPLETSQERNLLASIRAEPSPHSPHIKVTTRKSGKKSGKTSTVSKTSKTTVNSKRSTLIWLKEVPSSINLSSARTEDLLKSGSEYITKKLKVCPNFQEKMTSVKPTQLRDEPQQIKDTASKASLNFKTLMIRKFENDLERLLLRIANKLKKREVMDRYSVEPAKLLCIILEFEKSKFDGSDLVNSDIGKLIKAIHRLLTKNIELLNDADTVLIPTLAKTLHRIKESILKHCLDNTDYALAFKISKETKKPAIDLGIIDIESTMVKEEEKKSLGERLTPRKEQLQTPCWKDGFRDGSGAKSSAKSKNLNPFFQQYLSQSSSLLSGDKNSSTQINFFSKFKPSEKINLGRLRSSRSNSKTAKI